MLSFKWRHFEKEIILLVLGLTSELSCSGGNCRRKRMPCRSQHDLPLGDKV